MMGDMKKKYTIATGHFGETSSVEPETFFGYINTFMNQYKVPETRVEATRLVCTSTIFSDTFPI